MARHPPSRLSLLAPAAALAAILLAAAPPLADAQVGPTGTNLQIDDAAQRELVGLVELLGGFSDDAANGGGGGGRGGNIASLAKAAPAGLVAGLDAADGRVLSAALSLPSALRTALQSQQSKNTTVGEFFSAVDRQVHAGAQAAGDVIEAALAGLVNARSGGASSTNAASLVDALKGLLSGGAGLAQRAATTRSSGGGASVATEGGDKKGGGGVGDLLAAFKLPPPPTVTLNSTEAVAYVCGVYGAYEKLASSNALIETLLKSSEVLPPPLGGILADVCRDGGPGADSTLDGLLQAALNPGRVLPPAPSSPVVGVFSESSPSPAAAPISPPSPISPAISPSPLPTLPSPPVSPSPMEPSPSPSPRRTSPSPLPSPVLPMPSPSPLPPLRARNGASADGAPPVIPDALPTLVNNALPRPVGV